MLCRAHIHPADQGSRYCSNQFVLQGEEISRRTIVPFGPDVIACLGIDQLSRDPDALSQPADTALYQEAHTQLAPHCLDVDALTLEAEGGVARGNRHRLPA